MPITYLRSVSGFVTAWALVVALQACSTVQEPTGEAGGFGGCVTPDQGIASCDEYCASISRACVECGCPSDHAEDYLCSGDRRGSRYTAIGWKNDAFCQGQITTAYNGCSQNLFHDAAGALVVQSVMCCCE